MPQAARLVKFAAVALLLGACSDGPPPALTIASIAAPKNIATGGDALIQVSAPADTKTAKITLALNGAPVTAVLKVGTSGQLVAKVEGLKPGANTIAALYSGKEVASVTVQNFPAEGPVFSGPHQTPFVCTTKTFKLPNGETLGAALDADCTTKARVDYVYRATDGKFKPLPDPKALPADIANTTTIDKKTVKYIVRLESGTANRAIYQFAMLHDPNTDPAVDIWSHPAGWNGRLVYTYGGGYGGGFTQGDSTGGVLEDVLLSRGYAVASSSLNVAQTSANDVRSAETTLMVKEKFLETHGPVVHTIGWGASGGAMQQHHITQNYPGLLDGIIPSAASPDSVTRVGFVTDCSLLARVFDSSNNTWTEEQKTAVVGFASWKTCSGSWIKAGFSPGWIDPQYCVSLNGLMNVLSTGKLEKTVPEALRYNADTNPTGARCTYQDDLANILGRDDKGRGRRPLDSVGVQYGLQAFKEGKISAAQFVELNEKIGGWDIDAQWQPQRTVADPEALRLTYETGRYNGGGGGLAYTPTIDLRTYTDNIADMHDRVRALVTKARIIATNGDAANRVFLLFPGPSAIPPAQYHVIAIDKMEEWLSNIEKDSVAGPVKEKVVRAKPVDLKDGCFDEEGKKTDEDMAYGVANTCNAMYPVFGDARMVAGSSIRNSVLKCQLKPIDAADYPAALPAPLLTRLKTAFPDGVCDYSKPGVGETAQVGTWLSYDGTGKYSMMP